MRKNLSLAATTALEYLKGIPKETGSLTIAKALYHDYPEIYNSVEHARTVVRKYRGALGERKREKTINTEFFRPFEVIKHEQFGLPDPIKDCRDPYFIPKAQRRMLVIGDIHIPYQLNEAVSEALEYAYKKSADTILLNGDIMDCYPISRFAKSGLAPRLGDEIEYVKGFLKSLREAFPQALIIYKFGNHEERMVKYILDNSPEFEGIQEFDLENLLHLNEFNIIPVKDKRLIRAGELNILHGHEYGSGFFSPVNPARTFFLKAKENIMVNHFHQVHEHTGRSVTGKVIGGWAVGGLLILNPEYRPFNEWMNGYADVVLNEDGTFWVSNRKIL